MKNLVKLVALAIYTVIAILFGQHVEREKKPKTPVAVESELAGKLDELGDKFTQAMASRCMNITTNDVVVYQVPSLGVRKVPPPKKVGDGN